MIQNAARKLLKLIPLLGLLATLTVQAQSYRPTAVVDLRGESLSSQSLNPQFTLAQHLMSSGFAGRVTILVDDDYKSTGWASAIDLSHVPTSNEAGGTLQWMTISELAATPIEFDTYIRISAVPQDIAHPIVETPGMSFAAHTVYYKISMLGPEDKAAIEAMTGESATLKSFDGWIHYAGETFEIQSLQGRNDIPELLAGKSYSEYFHGEEANRLAVEIADSQLKIVTKEGKGRTAHDRFMDFGQNYHLLRSRLRLAWTPPKPCEAKLAKPASSTESSPPKSSGLRGLWKKLSQT